LSRDIVALVLTGRRLADATRVEAALRAYRTALEIACGSDTLEANPRFDEKGTGRYLLPGESLFALIIRDLASRPDWDYGRWSTALPDDPRVYLVAYRLLKESGSVDANRSLDSILNRPVTADHSQCPAAIQLAARAEALTHREKLEEAQSVYAEAVQAAEERSLRRTLAYNLANLAIRRGDDVSARDALEQAVDDRSSDAIGRRAFRRLSELDRGKTPSNLIRVKE
jgi:tetratricopeptide (TPR) repeat protein